MLTCIQDMLVTARHFMTSYYCVGVASCPFAGYALGAQGTEKRSLFYGVPECPLGGFAVGGARLML